MTDDRLPLCEDDIKEARRQFGNFLRMMTAAGKAIASATSPPTPSFESRNNDYYLEITLKDGRTVKLKTAFHVIEETIEDMHGGVFKCTYRTRETVDGLYQWLLDNYPRVTVAEIQSIADEDGISYEEAKKTVAFSIAEKEILIRVQMARFLHDQIGPALRMLLIDLLDDAQLYGYSQYGGKLADPKAIDKASRGYIQLRKKRTNAVEGVGKRGKAAVPVEEVVRFMEMVFTAIKELEKARRKVTPHAVARKVVSAKHSNPLKAFKDKLNKYEITFDDLKNEYQRIQDEQKNS